jgi:hypothetical protein
MMPTTRRALLPVLALLPGVAAAQGQPITTPPRGSALRRALLDTARAYAEAELGPPIEFYVRVLNTNGEFAFFRGAVQRPGGRPVDWNATRYAAHIRRGSMNEGIMVLMRLEGRRWRIVERALGPTHDPSVHWGAPYRLPRAIFEG